MVSRLARSCIVCVRFVICSSDENCAIWAMFSLSSDGFIGSWFFIWAIISLRKSSLPRSFFSSFALLAADWVGSSGVVVVVVGSMAMVGLRGLGEDVDERAVRQLDRPVGDGEVGLRRVAGGGRPAVAAAAALLVARGAGTRAGGLVAGGADVDADDVDALLLERAAQLARGLREQVGGLGHLGDDASAQALGRVTQVDLDAAELLRAQSDAGARDAALRRGVDCEADGLDGLRERDAASAGRRGGRGGSRRRGRRRSRRGRGGGGRGRSVGRGRRVDGRPGGAERVGDGVRHRARRGRLRRGGAGRPEPKSTPLNSRHMSKSYALFWLEKKKRPTRQRR